MSNSVRFVRFAGLDLSDVKKHKKIREKDGRTDGQTDGRTDGRTDQRMEDFQSTLQTNQVPASGINLAFKQHQEAVDDNFQHTFLVVACDWLI